MLPIGNLLRYKCAKNYQNRVWSDKVIAKIIRCSFLTHSVEFKYAARPFSEVVIKAQNDRSASGGLKVAMLHNCDIF